MAIDYEILLVDLGDVLCSWDRNSITALSSKVLQNAMHSRTWYDLERGKIKSKEAYQSIGSELNISAKLIEEALCQAQASIRINWELLQTLESLKKDSPHLRIFIASNISEEHFDFIQQMPLVSAVFDSIFTRIFTSSKVGMRKPDLCFYQHIIDNINCDAKQIFFIDNSPENLCAARSFGMHGVLATKDELPNLSKLLRGMLVDPSSQALKFLASGAGKHDSVIESNGIHFKDNFSQLLIWSLTGDSSIIYLKWPSGYFQSPRKNTNGDKALGGYVDSFDDIEAHGIDNREKVFNITEAHPHHGLRYVGGSQILGAGGEVNGHGNGVKTDVDRNSDQEFSAPLRKLDNEVTTPLWEYFCGRHTLTGKEFPPDADTTAIAYLTLPKETVDRAIIESVLNLMAESTNSDGILQVYFTKGRPRTCPVVCCNILRLFYRFDFGNDPRIKATENWVIRCLHTRACQNGTRHYTTPECFLYYICLLYKECGSADLRKRVEVQLRDALVERLHVPTNPLALAMRINACQMVGISAGLLQPDLYGLLECQESDGGWPAGHFCRFGSTGDMVGNRGLATALALKAITNDLESKG